MAGTPSMIEDEKETLSGFLTYLRGAIVDKVSGVGDGPARAELVPSGKSLLGLLKHLTVMELGWFCYAYDGQDLPQSAHRQEVADTDTVEAVVAAYQAAAARADAVIRRCADLELPGARTLRPGTPERPTLRWILVHLIEDTARHTGHADVLREQTDGLAGNWRGILSW